MHHTGRDIVMSCYSAQAGSSLLEIHYLQQDIRGPWSGVTHSVNNWFLLLNIGRNVLLNHKVRSYKIMWKIFHYHGLEFIAYYSGVIMGMIVSYVWHSYLNTILMQQRLVKLWMRVLISDKLPLYFVLLILHDLLSLSIHWITVWICPTVRFRGNDPSNPPGEFNIHFSHGIHL